MPRYSDAGPHNVLHFSFNSPNVKQISPSCSLSTTPFSTGSGRTTAPPRSPGFPSPHFCRNRPTTSQEPRHSTLTKAAYSYRPGLIASRQHQRLVFNAHRIGPGHGQARHSDCLLLRVVEFNSPYRQRGYRPGPAQTQRWACRIAANMAYAPRPHRLLWPSCRPHFPLRITGLQSMIRANVHRYYYFPTSCRGKIARGGLFVIVNNSARGPVATLVIFVPGTYATALPDPIFLSDTW